MKNNILKKLFIISIAFPTTLLASPLTIVNNTNHDSTSIINGGACSSSLGPNGVTRKHSVNIVPDIILKTACLMSPNNCRADIYMTDNCSGPKIASAVFSVNTGIISITNPTGGYGVIKNGPFNITMTGGPA